MKLRHYPRFITEYTKWLINRPASDVHEVTALFFVNRYLAIKIRNSFTRKLNRLYDDVLYFGFIGGTSKKICWIRELTVSINDCESEKFFIGQITISTRLGNENWK